MRVTLLGSGPSSGVPGIGVGWGACDPENPRNRRLRQSILVEHGATRLLVDTSPDLRQQLLRHDVETLDAVLYTHAHADHLHGIDDLRGVNRAMGASLPIYADAETERYIAERFGYTLTRLREGAEIFYKPVLDMNRIAPGDRFSIGDVDVFTIDQDHGFSRTLGFHFGDLAYSTDVLDLPEASLKALEGVDVWIIGVFSMTPHHTHAHVEKALEWIERVAPRQAVLTHLGPSVDYATLEAMTPDHVHAAYDNMVIELREGEIHLFEAAGPEPLDPAPNTRFSKSA